MNLNNTPQLSIITINRNDAQGLEKTLESIWKKQSFKDFEHIIIDGASTDNSINIIKKYASHLSYWVSEPDKGIYNAMNKGIRKASGEYLIFMNSGDRFSANDILEKIIPHFNNEDIVYGNAYYELENRKKYEYKIPSKITIGSLLKEPICHQSAFFRKELFEKYGMYDENNKIASDWTFMMDIFVHHNISQKYINVFISIFEKTGISSTNNNLGVGEQKKYLAENVSEEVQNMALYFDEYSKFYNGKPGTILRNVKDKIYSLIYRKKYDRKFVD